MENERMPRSLEDYREIVGDEIISKIHRKAMGILGKHVVHINSTYQGGGVAEMLQTLIPLMNDIGVDTGWRILHGNPEFFSLTKSFHNGLQGQKIEISDIRKRLYLSTIENFSTYTHIDHDFIIVHDPQPLPLLKYYKKKQPWVWRCHVDLSNPDLELWDFLKPYILKYDTYIVSHESYVRRDLPVASKLFPPAIDPLSRKNMPLNDLVIRKTLKAFQIPLDKPLITQISRFDKWKDPLGVLQVYKQVREKVDCRLILCGSMAADDPEGWDIYHEVQRQAENEINKGDVLLQTTENNLLVNVLQRASSVLIQKSLREGFGLTVTEGLWKGRPVVASKVGGIPLQIEDGQNGFLVEPEDIDTCADRVIRILKDPEMAVTIGKAGQEYVRNRFLITRLLGDYLDLIKSFLVCPQVHNGSESC
jgi:trehalose synthase